MKPLILPLITHRTGNVDEHWTQTSVLYQLFSLNRQHIPSWTLMRALDQASTEAVNETDHLGHSLLLNHLSRYSAPFTSTFASRFTLMLALGRFSQAQDGPETFEPNGGLRLTMRLLDLGSNPWQQDQEGRDALDQVLHLMWLPVLERLLDAPGAPNVAGLEARRLTFSSKDDAFAHPLLHAAALSNNHVLLDLMLARGLDVNARDERGRTPLFLANTLAMATRLIEAGADVSTTMGNGQDVSAYWTGTIQDSTVRTGLHLLVARQTPAPVGEDAIRDHRDQHRGTLHDLVRTGTKDNVLKFMRQHGFEVDDVGPVEGRPKRLVSVVLRNLMVHPERSPAVAQHLLERSAWLNADDPANLSTLFAAWLGTQMGAHARQGAMPPRLKFLGLVEERFEQRFGWTRPDGMQRFLDAFLPWVETNVPRVASQAEVTPVVEKNWYGWGKALFLGLDRVVRGTSITLGWHPEERAQAEQFKAQAGDNPMIRVHEPYQGSTEVRQTFLDPQWVRRTRPDGLSYAWWWASLAANLYHSKPTSGVSLPTEMAVPLWHLLCKGDAGMPAAPADAMALNAMLVVLSAGGKPAVQPAGWAAGNELHGLVQGLLANEVVLDPGLPQHAQRLEQVQAIRPLIASELEGRMLRATMDEQGEPTADARARRRL